MRKNAFLFDVICPRINLNGKSLGTRALSVDVSFQKIRTTIKSRHINVPSFQEKSGLEFFADIRELKYMINGFPIIFKVKHKSKVIGIGRTSWPYSTLSKIDSNLTNILHRGQCNLALNYVRVGDLDFVIRIRKQTYNILGEKSAAQNLETNLGKLNAFQIGRPQNTENINFVKTLPGNPYANYNAASLLSPQTNKVKKLVFNIQDKTIAIDKEVHKSGPIKYPVRAEGGADGGKKKREARNREKRKVNVRENEDPICRFFPKYTPPQEVNSRTLKYCSVCKDEISWIPENSRCPTCGFKPIPLAESLNNDDMTVKQIVREYANKPVDSINEDMTKNHDSVKKSTKNKLKCLCKGKMKCCFCLRKKLLIEMKLENARQKREASKIEPNTHNCPSLKECSQPRSFLKNVFSQLRTVYEKADHAQKKTLSDHFVKTLNQVTEKFKTPDLSGKAKTDSPLYNNNVKRQRFFTGRRRNCLKSEKNVPKNMGWLWTNDPRPNWKPGTIDKRIRKIIHYFKDIHMTTTPEAKRIACEQIKKICEECKIIPSTLRIQKKGDEYIITLNRTRDPYSDRNAKPITFKIVKHPKLILYRHLKRKFKDMGFEKCVCHKPISECVCRSSLDKKQLEFEVRKECCRRQIPCVNDDFILSKTSISEADIDIELSIPPQVVKKKQKKVIMLNSTTQYIKEDCVIPEQKPQPINQFLESYDGTVGEKYGKPRFIALPGQVIPGMEWKEALLAERRAKAAALRAEKSRLLKEANKVKVKKIDPPWGKNGPPGGFALDGTPLDKFGLPYCDAEGYFLDANGNRTGKVKPKPVDMLKYLSKQGLFRGEDLNPDYLAKLRKLRKEHLQKLSEYPPISICSVDRRGTLNTCGPCSCSRYFNRQIC